MNPLPPEILSLLHKATGLDNAEAWRNIWLLISKSEHDNDDPARTFVTSKGEDVFTYAAGLSYDAKDRGVTMGLVGWTTAYDGKDAQGDAMELFKIYASLGGENLAPLAKGCCTSKDTREKLISKIKSLAKDPAWVQAQWQQLVSDSDDGAYIFHTMKAWRHIGVPKPSALAIATVLDASLNMGSYGKDGGCENLVKLAVRGDENKSLEKYNAWRRKVAGTNDYNSPPINGKNRADMFEKLRKAKVYTLVGPDATKALKDALSWTMK